MAPPNSDASQALAPRAAEDSPAPRLRLRLLGGFELETLPALTPLRLPTRATMLLLARLALEPQRAHAREELVDLLWPEADAAAGRNRLRQALSALRAVLDGDALAPPALRSDRRTVSLAPRVLASDVEAFRVAVRRGDISAAQALCRGELLPGFYDEWVLQSRAELAARSESLERRAGAAVAVAMAAAAAPASAMPRLPGYLTSLHGFDEARAELVVAVRAHRLVVLRGPGGGGKTRLAVEAAHALQSAPPDEGPELSEGAACKSEPFDPFDLVAFVPLATCRTRAAMIDAVLLALHHGPSQSAAADASARVEQSLLGRRALLVLDNFEQLVDAAAAELTRWLSQLPQLHLLVTSRSVLAVSGEVEQVVPALGAPPPRASLAATARSPAVAMFIERARAARPGFALNAHNRADLAALVRRLQGLPLAIELAAARVRSLPLAAMLEALEAPAAAADADANAANASSGGTLALLARPGPRGSDDARHASMLDVVAWSWRLLGADARATLAALAVFDAGATLDGLATALGVTPAQAAARVDALVASSVAYVREGERGQGRYHPYEPMREYALAQLDAAALARLRARMREAVARWAAALGAEPALDAFRDELPNLAAACVDAVAQGEGAAALAMALDGEAALDDIVLPPLALAALRRAADGLAPDTPPVLAARGHALLAQQLFESGEGEAARAHAQCALFWAERCDGLARAGVLRAGARVLLRTRGQTADIEPLLAEALELAHRHRSPDLQARTLSLLAVLRAQRDHDAAASLALRREALALWQQHGPAARVAEGLVNLALGLGARREALAEKLDVLERARRLAAERGQLRLLAFVQSVTAYTLADLRRWDDAAAVHLASLRLAWDGAMWREWFYGLWNLPRVLAHRGRPEAAALLMGFAEAFYAQHFGSLGPSDRAECRRTQRLVRVQCGPGQTQALWLEGRGLAMAKAMRLAEAERLGASADGAAADGM